MNESYHRREVGLKKLYGKGFAEGRVYYDLVRFVHCLPEGGRILKAFQSLGLIWAPAANFLYLFGTVLEVAGSQL